MAKSDRRKVLDAGKPFILLNGQRVTIEHVDLSQGVITIMPPMNTGYSQDRVYEVVLFIGYTDPYPEPVE